MAEKVLMPKLGLTMTEGVVDKWLKAIGDPVKQGEVVVDISSEKLSYGVEAESDGTLLEIYVQEGEEVPVKVPIGLIGQPGEETGAGTAPAAAEEAAPAPEADAPAVETVAAPTETDGQRLFASPLARSIAKEKNIPLSELSGSGENGRITKRDVLAYTPKAAPAAPAASSVVAPTVIEGLSGIRKLIARNMRESLNSTAQLTITAKADITALMAQRKEWKAQTGDQLPGQVWSLNILLIKAVAKALRDHPQMNSKYDGTNWQKLDFINVGIATSLEDGLIVPNIKNADGKSLSQIQQDFARVTNDAQNGQNIQDDLLDGTFTITNLGGSGVEFFTPILNHPEVGILGVGAFLKELTLVEGEVQEVIKLPLSLTFDHQVIDGFPAAEFLKSVSGYLAQPYLLLV